MLNNFIITFCFFLRLLFLSRQRSLLVLLHLESNQKLSTLVYPYLFNHGIDAWVTNSIDVLKCFFVFNETFFHLFKSFFVLFDVGPNYFTYPRVHNVFPIEIDEIALLVNVLVEFDIYTFVPEHADYLSVFWI